MHFIFLILLCFCLWLWRFFYENVMCRNIDPPLNHEIHYRHVSFLRVVRINLKCDESKFPGEMNGVREEYMPSYSTYVRIFPFCCSWGLGQTKTLVVDNFSAQKSFYTHHRPLSINQRILWGSLVTSVRRACQSAWFTPTPLAINSVDGLAVDSFHTDWRKKLWTKKWLVC